MWGVLPSSIAAWQGSPLYHAGKIPPVTAKMFHKPDFPDGSVVKNPRACQRRTRGFDPWVGKSPWEEGDGNPLQYSCLENPMDTRAWRATVHGGGTELNRLSPWALAPRRHHQSFTPWSPPRVGHLEWPFCQSARHRRQAVHQPAGRRPLLLTSWCVGEGASLRPTGPACPLPPAKASVVGGAHRSAPLKVNPAGRNRQPTPAQASEERVGVAIGAECGQASRAPSVLCLTSPRTPRWTVLLSFYNDGSKL